jgi:hypothetical protein
MQPARAAASDSARDTLHAARDAYDSFGAPEEESEIRGLEETPDDGAPLDFEDKLEEDDELDELEDDDQDDDS